MNELQLTNRESMSGKLNMTTDVGSTTVEKAIYASIHQPLTHKSTECPHAFML